MGRGLVVPGVLVLLLLGATAAQALLRSVETVDDGGGAAPLGELASPAPTPTAVRSLLAAGPAPTASPRAAPLALPTPTLAPAATPTPRPLPTPTATPAPPTPTPTVAPPQKTGGGRFPSVNAAAVVVVDEASGEVLYDNGAAHRRAAPASTTKIATAIVAIERGNPADRVKVRFDASELVDSTLMGLLVGDEVTLEDLLYGLMLPSGNDAALAIAEHVAGSKARFVEMMNEKVRELGLRNTQFRNPHGLDEEGHYSSAYDLVMLARYGMLRHPLFVRLAGARVWAVRGSRSYEVYNLNRFLFNYPGADGVKIGYTEDAGRTIVASASRNGRRVYAGLLRYGNILTDTAPLFDYAFASYTWPARTR